MKKNDTKQSCDHAPQQDPGAALFVADAVYMTLVYAWILFLPPLGRDYAALARPDKIFLLRPFVQYAGEWMVAYHTTGLLLLYGCMALLLLIARKLTQGPWWLGSAAAVLFMANPVKTEAVLQISGMPELWTGITGLFFLWVYLRCRNMTGRPARLLPTAVYLVAILSSPSAILFFVTAPLYEILYCRSTLWQSKRWLPITLLGLTALFISGQWAYPDALHPMRMWAPLYLCIYPIGITPENAALIRENPVLLYGCAASLILLGLWIVRKVNNPTFTFGVSAAVLLRFCQGGQVMDPVTLAGGGRLLPSAAMLSLAAAGLIQAVLAHPQWRKAAVRLTTAVCIAAMVCQGWTNLHWLRAGRAVQHFQRTAHAISVQHPGKIMALVPDIQYYKSAPLMFSESVRYRTPFSVPLPVTSLFPLPFVDALDVTVNCLLPERIEVLIGGMPSDKPAPLSMLSREWWNRYRLPRDKKSFTLESWEDPLPDVCIPWHDINF